MSSNYPTGSENDPNAPYNEVDLENDCMYCGELTDNKYYCCNGCMEADLNH